MMHAESCRLYRFLRPKLAAAVTVTEQGIQIVSKAGQSQVRFADIGRVTQSRGLIWSKVRLEHRDSESEGVCVGGFSRRAATELRACIVERQLAGPLAIAASEIEQLQSEPCYLNWQRWARWHQAHRGLLDLLPRDYDQLPLASQFRQRLSDVVEWLQDAARRRGERNRGWVEAEVGRHKEFFDSFGGKGLSNSQRHAIVADEDHTLVVAGPGTGKTTALVGKVAYLLRTGRARPDEVLLLTFTKSVREQMQKEVEEACRVTIPSVHTFHRLGYQILGEVDGRKPSLSRLADGADGEEHLRELVEGFLRRELLRGDLTSALRTFLLRYRYPERHEQDFGSQTDYPKFLKSHGIVTLNGESVKSWGELIIADFLAAHGVAYEYEPRFEKPTATKDHREYRPDFRLVGYGPPNIYIEYFGVDRKGNTAPWVDREKYTRGMDWKRNLHKRSGTKLIEVYYYDLKEGRLEDILRKKLQDEAVSLKQVPLDQLVARREQEEAGARDRLLKPIVDLLIASLKLYRENNWAESDIRRRLPAASADWQRAEVFLDIFKGVLRCYEEELLKCGEIDFSDMITRATSYVQTGRWKSPFRYVLVDEFQDISRGRAQLLKAIVEQNPDCHLFAVGDDWQSIFRFAGNDLGILSRFSSYFGQSPDASLRVDLRETFRLSAKSVELTSRFIQQNPRQLKKALVPVGENKEDTQPPVVIVYEDLCYELAGKDSKERTRRLVEECVRRIPGSAGIGGSGGGNLPVNLLVLARYEHVLPNSEEPFNVSRPVKVEGVLTVHKAKGLEADYVVVLDVVSGRYGFPTEIKDDPLLDLFLSEPEPLSNAEERRLFYVAITRSRKCTFVVSRLKDRSSFVEELESETFGGLVATDYSRLMEQGRVPASVQCPECGGPVFRRSGKKGEFYGCHNFPYCRGYLRVCTRCGRGAVIRKHGGKFACSNPHCGQPNL